MVFYYWNDSRWIYFKNTKTGFLHKLPAHSKLDSHRCWSSRWFWHSSWKRLHKRPRCLWNKSSLREVDHCNHHVYGSGSPLSDSIQTAWNRSMKNNFAALTVGILFSIGLGVSGMTQPEKVFGFLDLFGNWNSSLAFVMIGAISIHAIAYRQIIRRQTPLFSRYWHMPIKTKITPRLIFGSFLFGVGWALAGYCPGPALTSLASFKIRSILFFASMISGMFLFRVFERAKK